MTDDAPITAYHGSPHDFEQFDTSKIGTGEGAQAYGHGLYFAEHEPVAQGYKNALTDEVVHIDGKRVAPPTQEDPSTEHIYRLANHMYQLGHTADQAIDYDLRNSEKLKPNLSHPDYYKRMEAEKAQKWAETILPFRGKTIEWKKDPGHMYEVAIDAHPDHFLDWDKPINGQSEHAKNAVSNLVADRYLHPTFRNELADLVDRNWFTGEKLHEKLTAKHGLPMAAGLLDKHGLHGIKYFDAGSRGSNEQQTRNYVVFDHNRVKVRRKYEQGGAVAKSPAKLHNPAIVEHVLTKVSAPPPALNPSPVASGDARSKPSGDTYV